MIEETEYSKLEDMLQLYEKVLHPDFFNALKKQMHAAYEENIKNAFMDAKISDDALWIEKELIDMKRNLGNIQSNSFFIKCFYKKLLKHFLT